MDVSVGSIQIHTDIVRKEWRMIQSLLNGAIQGVDLDGMHLCLADVVAISRYHPPSHTPYSYRLLMLRPDIAFPSIWSPMPSRICQGAYIHYVLD